jgi:carbamoyl-phosphate synthase large subunit
VPKRRDLKKICLIGAGPIVIGQACEFDYSGTQACKALKEEGYKVILVNSNPATIMTDPEMAYRTYIEPVTPEIVEKVIAKEKPDALLPTLGGQTALNCAVTLAKRGVLKRYGVELIGASLEAIEKAEDRDLFKQAMERIGLDLPKSGFASSMQEARRVLKKVGYPAIIRPSFTLGGTGGNVAYNDKEFESYVQWGLDISPSTQILIEESLLGWKEYELEVMRDRKDNVVIICSIENMDAMGVHTGDSITIAPAQTLTDKEYQRMRNASLKIIREIGVDTGGSNIQFAVNPQNGRMTVIEMNPRVSRSSALASKATGFPIAKFAAKLAVGYSLDEIPNDITQSTPASFEPTIDYVVTKIPRFTFEKFAQTEDRLTTQMRSVGEVMSIGRTFKESLQKALRSLETGHYGFETPKLPRDKQAAKSLLKEKLQVPNSERLWYLAEAMRRGESDKILYQWTGIDPWFLFHIRQIVDAEKTFARDFKKSKNKADKTRMIQNAKAYGFSDRRLATLLKSSEKELREIRKKYGVRPVYKLVDTCAAEFKAQTPYYYSSYEEESDLEATQKKKIMILGGGPNRIGQGIEFDYCAVHASLALREEGFETIMVNCNPETVSTDYDISDRLYFEPLTFEDVMHIVEQEKPAGIIVQFGGQTPLRLAESLKAARAPIIGTDPDDIDRAEDRKQFAKMISNLGLKQPDHGTALTEAQALKIARRVGFPVVVRPSYVLGGRGMEIVYDEKFLKKYMREAVVVSPDHPILIDKFLENATEIDVDAVSDGRTVIVAGIMEHIEEAGIHSGDSAMVLPPHSLSQKLIRTIEKQTKAMAKSLNVVGLMNVQFAIKDGEVFVIEVNPRASRTVPFVSKATGVPLAKVAAKAMAGISLRQQGIKDILFPKHYSVKESVFPFTKFPGVDPILGPEMKSTGEGMGIDDSYGRAFAKSQLACGNGLPLEGKVFLSIRDEDKKATEHLAKAFSEMGFSLVATDGTCTYLQNLGLSVERINKVGQGSPHIVDLMKEGKISAVINTPEGRGSALDSFSIRRTAIMDQIPYFTTVAAADAAAEGIRSMKAKPLEVKALQKYH